MKTPVGLVFDVAGSPRVKTSRKSVQEADTQTPVAVAVPAWFGMADRHQLARYLDPSGARPVGLVSSTLAGVYGYRTAAFGRRPGSAVLCLDVRRGWSAGLVRVDPERFTEIASWGIGPHEVAGRLDDVVVSPWLVDQLFVAAAAITDNNPIGAVLVIDDPGDRADLIHHAIRHSDHPWAQCQVVVDDARCVMEGEEEMLRRSDAVGHSVGALAHALTVRADGDPERLAMYVVAEEHALFPSMTRPVFELGPNDGAPLHFDVYEQRRGAPGNSAVDHRFVLRAHLLRERGYDQNMMVTFELGLKGLLAIGPSKAWGLEWQPGSLGLVTPR